MTELANIESDPPSGLAGTGAGTITLTGELSGFSTGSGISFTASPAAVPEPSSLLLAAFGGIGLIVAAFGFDPFFCFRPLSARKHFIPRHMKGGAMSAGHVSADS